jgi:hypothetical protein
LSYARYCIANERYFALTDKIAGMARKVYFKNNGETNVWNLSTGSLEVTVNNTMNRLHEEFGFHDVASHPMKQHVVYFIAYDMGKTIDMYVGESGDIQNRVSKHVNHPEMFHVKVLFAAARKKGIKEVSIFIAGVFATKEERLSDQRDRIVQAVYLTSSKKFRVINKDAATKDGSIKLVRNL